MRLACIASLLRDGGFHHSRAGRGAGAVIPMRLRSDRPADAHFGSGPAGLGRCVRFRPHSSECEAVDNERKDICGRDDGLREQHEAHQMLAAEMCMEQKRRRTARRRREDASGDTRLWACGGSPTFMQQMVGAASRW